MKRILALCGVVLALAAFALWRHLRLPTEYGTFTGAPRVEVSEALAHPQAHLHQIIAMEDVITKQCTSMGCYFFFQSGEKFLRVELAEVAMNAPKGRNGRKARVEGQLVPHDHEYQLLATAVAFE